MDVMGRKLVVPNATRWNSSYDSWKGLHEQKEHLNSLRDHCGASSFKAPELEYISEFVDVRRRTYKTHFSPIIVAILFAILLLEYF